MSGRATQQMIAAIAKQVTDEDDLDHHGDDDGEDNEGKDDNDDEDDDEDDYDGECVDTGGFKASGVSEPAEPSPHQPVEHPQPSIREFPSS